MARFFTVLIGLVIANFVYQYFGSQNWLTAADRSFFQFTALALYVSAGRMPA